MYFTFNLLVWKIFISLCQLDLEIARVFGSLIFKSRIYLKFKSTLCFIQIFFAQKIERPFCKFSIIRRFFILLNQFLCEFALIYPPLALNLQNLQKFTINSIKYESFFLKQKSFHNWKYWQRLYILRCKSQEWRRTAQVQKSWRRSHALLNYAWRKNSLMSFAWIMIFIVFMWGIPIAKIARTMLVEVAKRHPIHFWSW